MSVSVGGGTARDHRGEWYLDSRAAGGRGRGLSRGQERTSVLELARKGALCTRRPELVPSSAHAGEIVCFDISRTDMSSINIVVRVLQGPLYYHYCYLHCDYSY